MRKTFIGALAISLALALVGMGSCGHQPPTMPPVPTSPAPSATPSSNPALKPLSATPQGFSDGERIVSLRGISYIPPNSKVYGWPAWITDDILDEVKRNGGNFVAVRLGPFSRDGEGLEYVAYEPVGDLSRVNLDQWNPAFWNRVQSFVGSAATRGIYVEFDLIDAWVIEHGLSPWRKELNVNGYDGGNPDCSILRGPVDYHQQRWLNKVGEELGHFPNVIFQISNESGSGNCRGQLTPEWELSVYNAFKSNLQWRGLSRPVGTNSEDPRVESAVDYIERHACNAQPLSGKPTGVNEWSAGCRLSTAEFCGRVGATPPGGWFLLWGDGMDRSVWDESLKCLGTGSTQGGGVEGLGSKKGGSKKGRSSFVNSSVLRKRE